MSEINKILLFEIKLKDNENSSVKKIFWINWLYKIDFN